MYMSLSHPTGKITIKFASSFPGARTDPGGPKFCVYDVI